MRYQVDFLLSLKLQKIYYFGLFQKILLANQFAGVFTFDLFNLLILITGVHCYIVLVSFMFSCCCFSVTHCWAACISYFCFFNPSSAILKFCSLSLFSRKSFKVPVPLLCDFLHFFRQFHPQYQQLHFFFYFH